MNMVATRLTSSVASLALTALIMIAGSGGI